MTERHLRTEIVKPQMNTHERRFNHIPEFGKIIHHKGRKERKAHRGTYYRHLCSCVKEETFYYLQIRKTTEGTEDTEKRNKSLCSLCSPWLNLLAGIHCPVLNRMSLKKVNFLIEKDPKCGYNARALAYSIYGRGNLA